MQTSLCLHASGAAPTGPSRRAVAAALPAIAGGSNEPERSSDSSDSDLVRSSFQDSFLGLATAEGAQHSQHASCPVTPLAILAQGVRAQRSTVDLLMCASTCMLVALPNCLSVSREQMLLTRIAVLG